MIVLKVPFSRGGAGKSQGCGLAPDKIVECSEEFLLKESGISPVIDVDAVPVDQGSIEETNKSIFEKVKKYSFAEPVCLLGGDHSITYAGFKAFASKHPGAGLLVLDAHPGCGTDTDAASHECFVRKLIADKLVERDKVIIVGIRNWSGDEKQYLDVYRIKHFTMKQLQLTGFNNFLDGLTETVSSWPSIYLSIDIDVADPSCAPAASHIEPGGLSSRQLINLVQRIRLLKGLRMADIVEVDPKNDLNDITSKLAAKLLVELA
jgi:arginase family enzyme